MIGFLQAFVVWHRNTAEKRPAMTGKSQFTRQLLHKKIVTMPVAHDLRAKTTGRARFKISACAAPIRHSTDTLGSVDALGGQQV
jgi:hypothetical protein